MINDGGNVKLVGIDGPIVKLELEGACGSCPSSTTTMTMGIERALKEKIPEIEVIEQVMPGAPDLTEEGVESVLETVRPFLQMAGGDVKIIDLTGQESIQPLITLQMTGKSSTISSVIMEI